MATALENLLSFKIPRLPSSVMPALRRAVVSLKDTVGVVSDNSDTVVEDIIIIEDDVTEIEDDGYPWCTTFIQDGDDQTIGCDNIVILGGGSLVCADRTGNSGGMSNFDDGGDQAWSSSFASWLCTLSNQPDVSQRLIIPVSAFSISGTVSTVKVTVTRQNTEPKDDCETMRVHVASGGSSISSVTDASQWLNTSEDVVLTGFTASTAQVNAVDFEVWIDSVANIAGDSGSRPRVYSVTVEVCYT